MKECRKCAAGLCSHVGRCDMMLRGMPERWTEEIGSAYWHRCECPYGIEAGAFPVTVTRRAT